MQWNIVVLDDRNRFALHVWRYVSHSLGFGIGDVERNGILRRGRRVSETWIEEGEPIRSDEDRLRIWWSRADGGWRKGLDAVLTKIDRREEVLVLVDVHGEVGSSYDWQEACRHLESKGKVRPLKILVVSAYTSADSVGTAGGVREILPKSRETLHRVADLVGHAASASVPTENVLHVLVTGAGFEIRGERGGFGMPLTAELLEEMGPPFCRRGQRAQKNETSILLRRGDVIHGRRRFPVPESGSWKDDVALRRAIEDLAAGEDLDSYWDLLLEEELRKLVGHSTKAQRDLGKVDVLWRERRLREAFRRSLLRHDWGHMNQSLAAARLPWHAWLTTNYTQFANRAIALFDGAEQDARGVWRIIATAAEARVLAREGLDGQDGRKYRYLFKLHGDIAHLQTMAIAGHDKDSFSPLSMPMEDLYQVYASAERFLMDSLDVAKAQLMVWHIVGHGLQDRRLCELLRRASRHSTRMKQVVVVVNPHPADAMERLEKVFEGRNRRWTILPCPLRAAQYLARLERSGFPGDRKMIRPWLAAMREGIAA